MRKLFILVCMFLLAGTFYSELKAQGVAYNKLQSNPGAPNVFYLDFDGERVVNTDWNHPFYLNLHDFTVTPTLFTAEEVTTAYNIISDDYLPFNINVTTDRSVFDATPEANRLMVIFTPDQTWKVQQHNGVARGGSYYRSKELTSVVWVFKIDEGPVRAAHIGSHEMGHALGLDHQRSQTYEYAYGHGIWSPIMGKARVPQSKVVQWSDGNFKNAGQNNIDDIAYILNSRTGVQYRSDDNGNNRASATPLVITDDLKIRPVDNTGIIERRTDKDYFKFTSEGGKLKLKVNPPAFANTYGANLKIQARLFDNSGTLIATSIAAYPHRLGARLDVPIDAGQYFIEIDGIGEGDPYVNGYSDYGSLGAYRFIGEIVPIVEENNVNLVSIKNNTKVACVPSFRPKVLVNNLGSEVTSLQIQTSIDGTVVDTYEWTGTMAPFADKTITLPVVDLDPSNSAFSISVTQVNGGEDIAPENNTKAKNFLPAGHNTFPYVEKFKGDVISAEWTVQNTGNDAQTFVIKKYSSHSQIFADPSDRHSVYIRNALNKRGNDRLISKAFDLSSFQAGQFKFSLYMSYRGANSDGLKVLYSKDCGNTWEEIWYKTGSELKIKENQDFPLGFNDWRTISVKLSNDIVGNDNVMFAFESVDNSYGAIYLDNVTVKKVPPVDDCNGVSNGDAVLSECDQCVGGDTGVDVVDDNNDGTPDCIITAVENELTVIRGVHPTQNTGDFVIQGYEGKSFVIYDLLGNIVSDGEIESTSYNVNIPQGGNKGMFIVHIENDQEGENYRIIVE